jgi:hypothetical protein
VARVPEVSASATALDYVAWFNNEDAPRKDNNSSCFAQAEVASKGLFY